MSGKTHSVEEAIKNVSISKIDPKELERVLDDLIKANMNIIHEQRERSIDPLMGIAMKTMRGKADGQKINQILQKKIKEKLN